jgi:hypothetical protein
MVSPAKWEAASRGRCSPFEPVWINTCIPRAFLCRLLANLYSGNVYIWNYNDQVGEARKKSGGLGQLHFLSKAVLAETFVVRLVGTLTWLVLSVAADAGEVFRGHGASRYGWAPPLRQRVLQGGGG